MSSGGITLFLPPLHFPHFLPFLYSILYLVTAQQHLNCIACWIPPLSIPYVFMFPPPIYTLLVCVIFPLLLSVCIAVSMLCFASFFVCAYASFSIVLWSIRYIYSWLTSYIYLFIYLPIYLFTTSFSISLHKNVSTLPLFSYFFIFLHISLFLCLVPQ